ncbi:hypothetical protein WMF38_57590 [Sorangium sp. So ce118]
MRTQTVVMPLWGLCHGNGEELVRELEAIGDDSYLLMQSGPLFDDAAVMEEGLPS